jgi:dolichol-phosphate mannosyltransferase
MVTGEMSPIVRGTIVPTPLHQLQIEQQRPRRESSPPSSSAIAGALRLSRAAELTIVIPTYNERENIRPLLSGLRAAMTGTRWEAIFVDDSSPDGTAEQIESCAKNDKRIRLIRRTNERGLASACIAGIRASRSRYVAVMDSDLQHDETVLPKMLEAIRGKHCDVVVASRMVNGGSMGEFALHRRLLSCIGSRIGRWASGTDVADVMSGFFVVDRRYFLSVEDSLTGTGFKILLDLLASSRRQVRVAEVPYRFRTRIAGESKLRARIELEYLYLLAAKIFNRMRRRPVAARVPI